MAQPTMHILQYVASASVTGGKLYNSSDFTGIGNILQMKTKNVNVSIDGNVMFSTSFDDTSFIENGHTYVFDRDCVVAIASMVEVV